MTVNVGTDDRRGQWAEWGLGGHSVDTTVPWSPGGQCEVTIWHYMATLAPLSPTADTTPRPHPWENCLFQINPSLSNQQQIVLPNGARGQIFFHWTFYLCLKRREIIIWWKDCIIILDFIYWLLLLTCIGLMLLLQKQDISYLKILRQYLVGEWLIITKIGTPVTFPRC